METPLVLAVAIPRPQEIELLLIFPLVVNLRNYALEAKFP
jgi:hypothetical protein